MLLVVVLVPIAIMILACSLERYEAHTTRVTPTPRAPRTPAPEPVPAAGSHLRLVPGSGAERAVALDGPTERLRTAS
ncbi:hypothetical protein [Actinomycetospora cinnamomea]|uniref:Uncharacterized protein n=1 Tax=Actinomycetospora cinnamomea TaxID=663609 RepID=A0A2U1FGB8_9PSEU|nr:hypothetical protein [Actinomycetospora cinnamomea]PVZ11176.1 hypothetical protein C8D89_104391 [Actinomycetospora cinnamomea]